MGRSEMQERILRTIVRYAGDGRTFRSPEICLMVPGMIPLPVVESTVENLIPAGYLHKMSPTGVYRLNKNNAVVVELLHELTETGENTK